MKSKLIPAHAVTKMQPTEVDYIISDTLLDAYLEKAPKVSVMGTPAKVKNIKKAEVR